MKLSESWLREWVNPPLSTDELVQQITMAGLEVDAVEPASGSFTGVVVGEIVSVEQHPDADKLRVCQVAGNGEEAVQVVCGAPNARPGIKIPFATVGATLPPGEDGKPFKIKKAKLRGVESFGMLCAQTELQLGDDDDGLWELPQDAPTGESLSEYLSLDDQCIEVDLTPNRSDCLSVKGIARDVAVLNRLPLTEPEIKPVAATIADTFEVSLNAGEACSRYAGRVIKNVDLSQSSPIWLQEKLRRSGIRSIDPVVDVTNYVLLELGQPMHAFDLDRLSDGIEVRMAEQGEKLVLLDDSEIELSSDSLLIADGKRPLALAGVMGGADSGVSDATRHIFLESAFFAPVAIAGKARSYGLHTDSSHRFERGVDYGLQEIALERATRLLISIVGGEPGPVSIVENEHAPGTRSVRLRRDRVESGLGLALKDEEILDIITRLGLKEISSDGDGWNFSVPSYRFDIDIEEDLLEELARVYGYNNLPTRSLSLPLELPEDQEQLVGIEAIKAHMVGRGFSEVITYSFLEPALQEMIQPGVPTVPVKNPISADMSVMRTSLVPGLLSTLKYNLNRQQTRVRIFETGMTFKLEGEASELKQKPAVAGLIYGDRNPESWYASNEAVDFYDLKGDVESLFDRLGEEGTVTYSKDSISYMHPGQCAVIHRRGEKIGYIGALHPQIQKQLGLPKTAFIFELDQQGLSQAKMPAFEALSRFPEVKRDLAVVVDQDVAVADLTDVVRGAAGNSLISLRVFDVYVGEGIDSHRKSVALSLTYQEPSRTLNEDEINASIADVVKALEESHKAVLR